jgi:tRNA A-37 threonylcarbamoyl transferase component Bud32
VAELEVAVRYKTLPATVGFFLMTASMPVWSIITPFCLGLFLTKVLTSSAALPMIPILGVLLALTALPLLAIALTAICEDDRVVISKEGLSFPLFMMPLLKFRRERHWSDLSAADLHLNSDQSSAKALKGWITLFFRSGGRASVEISKMDKSELEQMMLALEVWGVNCDRSVALIEYQNNLQNETRGIERFTYTQMWEEELSRRFSATSFVPLEPGKSLLSGRLKVVRQLAFGGLSAIYLAQDRQKDLVVIKEAVVPANADANTKAKAVEHFEREARFLMRLSHPQIAKVVDHFSEEGRNYLILEYIRGQDLRQLVKQHGAQSEAVVLDWSAQIASILQYLHNQSPPIIHRDLTPDNLVRREDGNITLIDFGAANEFVGNATGTLVGKQAYIAPEQLRGKASLASDLYALGGTMYFLLTGEDPEALMSSHPNTVKAELTDETDNLVANCTELEQGDRPESAAILHEKIRACIASLPSDAKTTAAAS